VSVGLVLVLLSGLFAYSVAMRQPWFGKAPKSPETLLTSDAVLFARNWYREGPWKLWFGLFRDPDSIEFPTVASRTVYTSYPPGGVLPIYALGKILHREPSLSMVMTYNLANHYATTLLISLLLLYFLRKTGCTRTDGFMLAAIPIFAMLFLPSPAYQFQMSHFHDMSVLSLFVLYVLLECIRDHETDPVRRRWLSCAQGGIAFVGILSDWLFACVAVCLYVKRLATGEILCAKGTSPGKALAAFFVNSFKFWCSFGLGLGLFALQLHHFGRFAALFAKFKERSGMGSGHFFSPFQGGLFWHVHMTRGYGTTGKVLVGLSLGGLAILLAYACVRRVLGRPANAKMNRGVALIFLLLAPCLLEIALLGQHSSHVFHFFASTKFAVPIAAVPFVLLPVTLLAGLNIELTALSWAKIKARCIGPAGKKVRPAWSLVSPLLVLLAVCYVYGEFPRVREQFRPPPKRDPVRFGEFIAANTAYEDVLFALTSDLTTKTSVAGLAYAMKRVHFGYSMKPIYNKLEDVEGGYVVNYLVNHGGLPRAPKDVLRLLGSAYWCTSFEGVLLYKIRKDDFLRLCRELDMG